MQLKKLYNQIMKMPVKMELYVTVVALVICILIVLLMGYGSIAYASSECESKGGKLIKTQKGHRCVKVYADGGKECDSSFDCDGRCYVHAQGETPICEYDSYPNKCRGTISMPPINCE